MLTDNDIQEILDEIEYKDWAIVLRLDTTGLPVLQVQFTAPDSDTGVWGKQHGRKWLLSRHMVKSEIVSTALKAVLTAIEHEAREDFKYRGVAVYNSHTDVDALLEIADRQDVRV
jgi:hypothetical protein